MKKTIAYGSFAIFVALFFAMHGGAWGVATAHADDCTLNQADFAKIVAIQNDPTLGYLDEVKQELAVRKELVSETITCAQGDVTALQTSLNAATTTDSASANLQSQLSGKLDDATNFYNLELSK